MSDQDKERAGGTSTVMSICLDEVSKAKLRAALDSLGGFELVGELDDYLGVSDDHSLVDAIKKLAPDICLLDFAGNPEAASRTGEQFRQILRSTAIFAMSDSSDPELIISAMRCGCTEYLVKPLQTERLVEALLKAGRKRNDQNGPRPARQITFLGAKGGAGVTTLVTHLGNDLARQTQKKTLLIDQHPDLGDVSLYLGLGKHDYNFFELVRNLARLDQGLLDGFLVKHEGGLNVLTSPENVGICPAVSAQAIAETLKILRSMFEVVLIDCPPGLGEWNLAAIESSAEVYLVATPELPAIRNLARYLEYLGRFNFPVDKIRVIINRFSKKTGLNEAQIEKAIRRPIFLTIPNSYAEVMEGINTGVPCTHQMKSGFCQAIHGWMNLVAGVGANETIAEPKKLEAKIKWNIF